MFKRPRPGEKEEDILRMQEEFLRERIKNEAIQPAAQVVNLRSASAGSSKNKYGGAGATRKPSKYAQSRAILNNTDEEKREKCDPADDKVYFPQVIPSVLGDIIEKNVDRVPDLNFPAMPSRGFPSVDRLDPLLPSPRPVPDTERTISTRMEVDEQTYKPHDKINLNIPEKSYLLTSDEAEAIHEENVDKLKNMTEEEILNEQQKLLSNLDPLVIEFLRKKRKSEEVGSPNLRAKETVINKDISTEAYDSEHDTLWENDVLTHPEIGRWLHFNNLEKDKLEWMKGMDERKDKQIEEPYEARFDFKGYLLPYTIEYSEQTKSLYHHGEEPDRPGYSLSELFELSRSTVTQQRVMALNTLAGILEYWSAGTYEGIIDIPISKMLFIIRYAIDENRVIMLEPALKALRNLVYNRIDEASLDALIGFEQGLQQPYLENCKQEIEELDSHESELKDFHLAEIDIITALVRTDIIQRLYYILNSLRPSFNSVQYALQIIIRLVRDSPELANQIIKADHLISTIVNNFTPKTSINFSFHPEIVYNGKPIIAALKLLRVLTLQSREISEILVKEYNILSILSEYISSGVDGTYGLRLQTEAFCILSNVLQYGIGVDHALSLMPVVVTALFKHVQGTDIFITSSVLSATHAAVVLQFVSELLKNTRTMEIRNLKQQIYPLLEDGMRKWLTQLSQSTDYSCAHLRLASSALDCWKTIMFLERLSPNLLNDLFKLLPDSGTFKMLANQMQPCSNLLSQIEIKDLNQTKNLISLSSSVIDSTQKVLPVLNVKSPFPFLASFIKLLILLNDKSLNGRFMGLFSPYLKKLEASSPSLCDNWFTRVEVDFLVCTVKLSSQMDLSEADKDLLYTLTSKICYILRADKKNDLEFLFDNIIFNRYWFTAERLMNLVSLTDANEGSQILTSIEEIRSCFGKLMYLNYMETAPNVMLRKWQEPALPRDWIYLPILHLYSRSQDVSHSTDNGANAALAAEKETIIRCNLVWILFNELCFPDLLEDISVTDRFCRIMCVYLSDNSIFLDKNVNYLLRKILKILFAKKDAFNFDKKLIGLNNFQDLYTQFLEQFQAVSYGEESFAACVAAPLAQRHSARWRRLLWSEYAGALRALHVPPDLLCGGPAEYLRPPETDRSLLRSYARALAAGLLRPDSLAHRIAAHHVAEYRKLSDI